MERLRVWILLYVWTSGETVEMRGSASAPALWLTPQRVWRLIRPFMHLAQRLKLCLKLLLRAKSYFLLLGKITDCGWVISSQNGGDMGSGPVRGSCWDRWGWSWWWEPERLKRSINRVTPERILWVVLSDPPDCITAEGLAGCEAKVEAVALEIVSRNPDAASGGCRRKMEAFLKGRRNWIGARRSEGSVVFFYRVRMMADCGGHYRSPFRPAANHRLRI